MTSWIPEAALNYQALAQMIEAEEVALNEIPEIMLHNLYLISSYLYYNLADQILSDHTYDLICRFILENFERFKAMVWWPDKTLDRELLAAGSGFSLEIQASLIGIAMAIYRRAQ